MKRYTIHTLVPALALLAMGCSTPTAMQSTEYDDMYYTSSDKTEYIQPEVTAEAEDTYETEEAVANGGVINPEYSDDNSVMYDYEGDEYYDGRSYDPRDSWYRPSHSYVDPYWGSAYAPRYSSRYHMAMRDPFYDPFYYDPFYYDSYYNPYQRHHWRSGVSVSIAFGSVWGNPYWGNPYAGHYYSNWYPYNSYYNGFHHGYNYGRNQYIYDRPGYFQARQVQYGPRTERSSIVTSGSRDNGGRPDRGSLSSDKNQDAVSPATGTDARPARTRGTRTTTDNTKKVITTRPDATRRTRTQRATPPAGTEQQQQVVPVRRRTRGEYVPATESTQPAREQTRPTQRRERTTPVRQEETRSTERRERPAPVRQETRSTERRERPAPVRQAPVRTYERSESRPAPVRSSSSSSSSSSGSSTSERSSGGRPTRGGN